MLQARQASPRALALLPYVGLVVLSVVYRAPALLSAGTVDSDAAIVGLEARHLLHGEWSWFLYGSGYQTSTDSCVAALFFLLIGATPLALMLSTLTGHVAATCLAFATLARHVSRGAAFVASLPLVLTSCPLHTYILNPPRQAAITLVFVAVFVIDGATVVDSARRRAGFTRAFVGAAIAALACFADPYALLVFPALLLLGTAAAFDDEPPRRLALRRILATAVGALVGIVPLLLLLSSPASVHGETGLTLSVLPHNWALLVTQCLPWLLGAVAYVPRDLLGYVPWSPGAVVRAVQHIGAFVFVLGVTAGGISLVRPSLGRPPLTWPPLRGPPLRWPVRRLGGFGFVVGVATVASFLVSVMVMDLFAARYLAALVLMSPFALAPLASHLGARRLLLVLSPYLVSAGLAGWVGYGDAVAGPRIVTLADGGAGDELSLERELTARGIHAAIADYWVSYRLTFLYKEDVVVVPIHAREDRYAPYRRTYAAATRTAYIFDPKRSREDVAAMEQEAFAGSSAWGTPVETLHAGSLTAIVFDKPPRASGLP